MRIYTLRDGTCRGYCWHTCKSHVYIHSLTSSLNEEACCYCVYNVTEQSLCKTSKIIRESAIVLGWLEPHSAKDHCSQ